MLEGVTATRVTGNEVLLEGLAALGVRRFFGLNGGGVIHVAKQLDPLSGTRRSGMFSLQEYCAGFAPLGYHVAGGGVAACITTTGAATKLAASGMSDAVFHNIPAVYVVALNSLDAPDCGCLQDVSPTGMNIAAQLRAEFGQAVLHVDDVGRLPDQLDRARALLARSRPVIFAVHPDVLCRPATAAAPPATPRMESTADSSRLYDDFSRDATGRKVTLLVCDEAARYRHMRDLTTELCDRLGAAAVYSINGAAGVAADNPYAYGYISFGGNDAARELWQNLGVDDVVVALGFEPGEYVLDRQPVRASVVYHFTNWPDTFGARNGRFDHRCAHRYRQVPGDVAHNLHGLLAELTTRPVATVRHPPAPRDLNHADPPTRSRKDCVDFAEFLQRLHRAWRSDSIGFDDVCMSYKDRPYVTGRPHPHLRYFSAYQGSAMGSAYAMAVGAKLARPDLHTLCFSGDGCFRFYGATLADTARLGLCLFIINNGTMALVDQGLAIALPDVPSDRFHSRLAPVDFAAVARAQGWRAMRAAPDLSNLDEIVTACRNTNRSMLIDVPVDPGQKLGPNPRMEHLTLRSYL